MKTNSIPCVQNTVKFGLKLQAYNLRRALNILGVERLIEAVAV
jgi:hypothetical protein